MQQALLVKVFAASAAGTAAVAAYSVGQQIAIATLTALVGLGAVVFIFRFRSFREVIAAGRASREAERRAERAGVLFDPAAPTSRLRKCRARLGLGRDPPSRLGLGRDPPCY